MDFEQLAKKVQWLDEERRKEKNYSAILEERIATLENKITASDKQNLELEAEIARLKVLPKRMDKYDETINVNRAEFNKEIKEVDKATNLREEELKNILRAEIRAYENQLIEFRKELSALKDLKKGLNSLKNEDARLAKLYEELAINLNELNRLEEDKSRGFRLFEDSLRQDSKRVSDLQGELASLRKRSEEYQSRIDFSDMSLQKLETRLNELLTSEEERINLQTSFQEKQALAEVDRESKWKEWQVRFKAIEKQAIDAEDQLQMLDSTFMKVTRTQDAVDDLMKKVERRINEVSEIQRLAEERFRQEWNTFKADDQKRWTNYTISQDEQRGEIGRRFERLTERVTNIEDNLQEIQDLLEQVNDLNARNLQALLSAIHEWATGYERTRKP